MRAYSGVFEDYSMALSPHTKSPHTKSPHTKSVSKRPVEI